MITAAPRIRVIHPPPSLPSPPPPCADIDRSSQASSLPIRGITILPQIPPTLVTRLSASFCFSCSPATTSFPNQSCRRVESFLPLHTTFFTPHLSESQQLKSNYFYSIPFNAKKSNWKLYLTTPIFPRLLSIPPPLRPFLPSPAGQQCGVGRKNAARFFGRWRIRVSVRKRRESSARNYSECEIASCEMAQPEKVSVWKRWGGGGNSGNK